MLVRATAAARVLEIGTSIGYSTIWLADAAEAVGGARGRRSSSTRSAARPLAGTSSAPGSAPRRCGSRTPREALRGSADECWDLIFLDAERPAYAGYRPEHGALGRLVPGGLVAVDNVISHAEQVEELLGPDGRRAGRD